MPNEVFDSLLMWAKKATEAINAYDFQKIGLDNEDKYASYKKLDDLSKISMFYDVYSKNTPAFGGDGVSSLNDSEKDTLSKAMVKVEADYLDDLKMFGQGNRDISIEDAIKNGGGNFAFFMEDRNPEKNADGSSRVTLTFDPKKADKAFEVLAAYLKSVHGTEKGKSIQQLKVLGPNYQGERTDSGIIYLTTKNKKEAKSIATDVSRLLGSDENNITMYNHTPFGMSNIADGCSYSQQGPFSSSHGRARSKVIKDTMDLYLTNADMELSQALEKALRMNGYNVNNPESLDEMNYLENLEASERSIKKKIEVIKGVLDKNPKDIAYARRDKEGYKSEISRVSKRLMLARGVELIGDDKEARRNKAIKEVLIERAVERYKRLFGGNQETENQIKKYVGNRVEEEFLQKKIEDARKKIKKALLDGSNEPIGQLTEEIQSSTERIQLLKKEQTLLKDYVQQERKKRVQRQLVEEHQQKEDEKRRQELAEQQLMEQDAMELELDEDVSLDENDDPSSVDEGDGRLNGDQGDDPKKKRKKRKK